jgi:large subunit ribosomal protein L15
MKQHELRPPVGARRERRRIGRGHGTGQGTTAGKGTKGQKARAGGGVPPYFEGGQLPLVRRLPYRRGFRNPFRVAYIAINLRQLASFPAGSRVTPDTLVEAGLLHPGERPVKILADGDLTVALHVQADRVSASARAKIEAAGGSVEELSARPTAEAAPAADAVVQLAPPRRREPSPPAEEATQGSGTAPEES